MAGGAGTRLHPMTKSVSKQLIPVYDKPMIYYPLSTLMLAGIQDVLIINTPREQALFRGLLGDGSRWGMNIEWAVQPSPGGLAQAFHIAEGCGWLRDEACALVLGDNIFYGSGLQGVLRRVADAGEPGATVFGYWIQDPRPYGVATIDELGKVIGIEEKPAAPQSHWAVTGLYFYDHRVAEFARKLSPSARGEYEITDLNKRYLEDGSLRLEKLGRGIAWLDTGTAASLLAAGQFVQTLQERQGLQVACLEEISYRNGWIDAMQLRHLADQMSKTAYGEYLKRVVEGGDE